MKLSRTDDEHLPRCAAKRSSGTTDVVTNILHSDIFPYIENCRTMAQLNLLLVYVYVIITGKLFHYS